MKKRFAVIATFGALMVASSQIAADPLDDIFNPPDSNGVLPIERILDQTRTSVAGVILEVELEREHGRLIYEVLVLTPDNRKVEIEYDARTGAELSREVVKRKSKRED